MNNTDFFVLLLDNISIYIVCFILTVIPFIFIIRKVYLSIIDPLIHTIIFAILANVIPVFLYFIGSIESRYFFYFVLAESLFWWGFLTGRKLPCIKHIFSFKHEEYISIYIYIVFFVILFVMTIFTYVVFGIPMLMENRMAVFINSGGFGVIARLSPFITTYCVFYSYYILSNKKNIFLYIFSIIVLLSIMLFSIFSGSRSSFLIFAFSYFGYCYYYNKKIPKKKISRNIIIFAIIGAFYMFSFSAIGYGWLGALTSFIVRIVANGDVYWSAYPNGIIENVKASPWYIELFSGFIFPLRLADISNYPAAIGQQLTWLNNPMLSGVAIGANARPPIMGYVLFGWFGLIFSYILGMLISWFIKVVKSLFPSGILGAIIAFHIYMQLLGLVTDPTIGFSFLFDGLIGVLFLLFIAILGALFINIRLNV